MSKKNELEKKLIDKWSHITNPCGEIPLEPGNPMQQMTINIATLLENQDNYLKDLFKPPEEAAIEDLDEYEKEMSKNLLVGHFCDNCEYSACKKEHKEKYGTCSVWKSKADSLFGGLNPNIMFPIIRKAYPTLIANELISVQPITTQNSPYIKYGNFSNNNQDITMDDPEPELTDEQIAERDRLNKMTLKQKKRARKPRWSENKKEDKNQ